MARLIKNRSVRRSLPPGGFQFDAFPEKPLGHYMRYNAQDFSEGDFEIDKIKTCENLDPNYVHWFHIEGFGQEEFIKIMRDNFRLPVFQMADVFNIDHHPKIEDLDDLLFFLLKSAEVEKASNGNRVIYNHTGVFLGHNFILTFAEKPLRVFDFVKDRIRNKKGKIRDRKEDFLFYSLIDAIMDNYFYVVEVLGNEVEELEKIVSDIKIHNKKLLPGINRLKMEFLLLRKLTTPLDESVELMNKLKKKIFDENIDEYLDDLEDHSTQLMSVINGYYSMLNDILQIYTANVNLQTNRIITFLTLFTSIFIPLTFIVGVYGMNFKHMPELDWVYGYPLVWAINLLIAIGMVIFFKSKKWL